jgi:dihydrofolate synthase/folylpolyglutamate synthase
MQGDQVLFEALQLDLTGSYQLKNILTVIASVLELRFLGYRITDEAIYSALKDVRAITGLQGRWQVLGESPLVICDTGHNYAGILEVVENIKTIPYQNLHIVFGVLKDKDVNGVLKLLPKNATYYFTQPDVERALPANILAEQAVAHELHGEVFLEVGLALEAAKRNAGVDDLIFIGGSTFVVAEVL